MLRDKSDSFYVHLVVHTVGPKIGNNIIITDKMRSCNFNIIQEIKYVEGQTDTQVELSRYSPTVSM
jgi:hypothetical protein